jgi:hypothetical protein
MVRKVCRGDGVSNVDDMMGLRVVVLFVYFICTHLGAFKYGCLFRFCFLSLFL